MIAVLGCATLMMVCLTVDMPWLSSFFSPTAPVSKVYFNTK